MRKHILHNSIIALANDYNLGLAKLTETQNDLDQASAEELQILNQELNGADLSEAEVAAL